MELKLKLTYLLLGCITLNRLVASEVDPEFFAKQTIVTPVTRSLLTKEINNPKRHKRAVVSFPTENYFRDELLRLCHVVCKNIVTVVEMQDYFISLLGSHLNTFTQAEIEEYIEKNSGPIVKPMLLSWLATFYKLSDDVRSNRRFYKGFVIGGRS